MKFHDLGSKSDGCCSPCGPHTRDGLSYPTFYFSSPNKLSLRDGDFSITLKGRKVEAAENTRDEDDPKFRYEIEVHAISDAEAAAEDIGSSMRAAAKKMQDRKMLVVEVED